MVGKLPGKLSQSRLNPVSDFHFLFAGFDSRRLFGLSQSRLNPVSDFHVFSAMGKQSQESSVTIPFKPGLRFSRDWSWSPCVYRKVGVTIPFKPGLRFSRQYLLPSRPAAILVTIPFKPGLRFSRRNSLPRRQPPRMLSQSRLNPVSDFHGS